VTPDALAALCSAAMPEEQLTVDELTHLCFGVNDPGAADEIFGDERGAAVMQTQRFGAHVAAWLVLVAVPPDHQSMGRGKELVAAVIERAREIGARDVLLASAIPRYLWPGVDTPTSFRREPPAGVVIEQETGTGAHAFAAEAYPHWVPELDRSVSLGTAFAARAADGRTIGFACHSVNRAGWIGPMATDPTLQHGGVGSAVLAALCADLEHRGFATGEISWVSNLRFYGKCGARVSRVFLGGRLSLTPERG
jgi:GNAT superfamily N-acetyltransferase